MIHTISVECPKCKTICSTKPLEGDPTLGEFTCPSCGVHGIATVLQ